MLQWTRFPAPCLILFCRCKCAGEAGVTFLGPPPSNLHCQRTLHFNSISTFFSFSIARGSDSWSCRVPEEIQTVSFFSSLILQCTDVLPQLPSLVAEILHQQCLVTPVCRENIIDSNSWGRTGNTMGFSQQRVKNFSWTPPWRFIIWTHRMCCGLSCSWVYFNSLISMQSSFQMAIIHETTSMIGS